MISSEHTKYLKKIKKQNRLIKFCQLSIILIFILIWQLLADKEIINTFIFSSPKQVLQTIINLYDDGTLFRHIYVTVYETIISFSIATILGCIIATILWWNHFIEKVVDPYLTILNSLPKVALGPIIIIWCGANIKSIIIMALLISLIITIINITHSFKEVDKNKIKLMQSFKATKWQTFTKLILPSSFKAIISTLKINTAMSLIGVIMGEFLVSKEGIGYIIMYGSQVFNLNLVITGIILLCIISAIMYYIVFYIEKRLNK